ncbi:MAG: DNA-directed RNA polymerase subunit omega [Gemmatimonadetes bacterium]|nr:DNA-directed RNA polymerase subunit omega [Gemmatimonadota bacterium]
MRVFTAAEVAEHNQSKYQGVLVAARYARELNILPMEVRPLADQKKLSTRALEAITSGQVEYRLVRRRRPEAE